MVVACERQVTVEFQLRDGCPIQVMPSPSSARNLAPGNPERYTSVY